MAFLVWYTPRWPPFHCFGRPIWLPWHHVHSLYMLFPFTSTSKRVNLVPGPFPWLGDAQAREKALETRLKTGLRAKSFIWKFAPTTALHFHANQTHRPFTILGTSLASHSSEIFFVLKHECEAKDVPSIVIQNKAPFMQRVYIRMKSFERRLVLKQRQKVVVAEWQKILIVVAV